MKTGLNAVIAAAAAAALAAGTWSCSPSGNTAGEMLTIKGSDTMVHLVSDWAESYMDAQPDLDVSVSGGGSGVGIKAFINGTTDIAAASRDLLPEEVESATAAGRKVKPVPVAMDGIAIVVNPRNPVKELTLEQLRKIYNGAYTRWSDVGGPDETIGVLSRESSSGTFVFFQEHVLQKEDYAAHVRLMPATAGIMQTVGDDAWAIGYVGLGYATGAGERVKVVPVKADESAPAVLPSEETVKSGAYSIARPLYLVTVENPSAPVQTFIDFVLSEAGQEIVRRDHYIPVR